MIKLKNKEASHLLSPVAQRLFSDSRRPFPAKDTFLILDLIGSIEPRIKQYNQKVSEIVSENDGEILPTGALKFKDESKRAEVESKIEELSQIELEYPGEKLRITDGWPNLSVQEAHILKPIIEG